MREVDAYRLFDHVPNIISAVDHCVATERGADEATKTVYVLLPYYRRGNLQDLINANLVNHATFPERRLMVLFLGVCKALRAMHQYKPPVQRMEMGREEDQLGADASAGGGRTGATKGKRTEEEEEGEQERPLMEGENHISPGGKVQSYAHRDIKPGGNLPAPLQTPRVGARKLTPRPLPSQATS